MSRTILSWISSTAAFAFLMQNTVQVTRSMSLHSPASLKKRAENRPNALK